MTTIAAALLQALAASAASSAPAGPAAGAIAAVKAPIDVEIIRDFAALATLREGWETLEAHACSGAASFAYARAAWEHMDRTAAELAIVVARQAGEMVGVWPLFVRREGLLRSASHLGSGSNDEYAAPLIAGNDDAIATAMLQALARSTDVLNVYNVPPDAAVSRVIKRTTRFRVQIPKFSPVVTLRGVASWEQWTKGKSGSFRRELRRDRTSLAGRGRLLSTTVEAGEAAAFVSWLFARKREHLLSRGITRSWVHSGSPEGIFSQLMQASEPHVQGFALKLDGQFVAGQICLSSAGLLECFVSAYEREFQRYSPGLLLIEDCVRYAIEQDLDCDFRLTPASYKSRWADRRDLYESFIIATSVRGLPLVAAAWVKYQLRRIGRAAGRLRAVIEKGAAAEAR